MSKPITFGVSLASMACEQYDQGIIEVMEYGIHELGMRRFRLMSYWHETEKVQGSYDFSSLESQLALAKKYNCEVSLSIGMRQPRWPECHVPEWAKKLNQENRNSALFNHISYVIKYYGSHPNVVSYQLENEALNHGIGLCRDYDRSRLRREYELVKKLDPTKPIIMSTSNSWGIPVRRPVPDVIGFSYYLYQWTDKGLSERFTPAFVHRMRTWLVRLSGRAVFCHELQAEPWGAKGTEHLSLEQQLELMDSERLKKHIAYALETGVSTIDMWGIEWWYSLPLEHRQPIDTAIRDAIQQNQ